MLHAARRMIADLTALAFPGRCCVCRAATPADVRCCDACEQSLSALERRPQCRDCGAPLAMADAPCQRCRGRGYRLFDTVVNLGVYGEPLRGLMHRLKFYHGWTLGEVLADRAAALPRVRDLMRHTDVLVPVPLHGFRQITRGFNQADVVARRLGRTCGIPTRRPVVRLRRTAAQSLLTNKLDRMRNLSGAFAVVRPAAVRGRRVTLVDDVMTTGSTLKAMAKAIATAEPLAINVFTIALVDPAGHDFEAV